MEREELNEKFGILRNTIYLSALLHDIGKFYQRASDETKGTHSQFTGRFFEEYLFEFHKERLEREVDLDLAKELASHHHENPSHPTDSVRNISGKAAEFRHLGYLISRADNYSSKERSDEDGLEKGVQIYGGYKFTPLNPVFIRLKKRDEELEKLKEINYYWPVYFNPSSDDFFPKFEEKKEFNKEKFKKKFHRYLKDLWQDFLSDFERIEYRNFEQFFEQLDSLLEKYCWAIPSSTQESYNDISLYDHLKTTAAIAGALFEYHYQNDEIIKNTQDKIKDDFKEKFLLIGGDISGIQSWIFNFKSSNSGASKLLRARSFYLSILEKATAYFIVKELNMKSVNILYSNGGRFLLLLPNTPQAKEKLSFLEKKIEEWCFKYFEGEVAILLSRPISFAGRDFSVKVEKTLKPGERKSKYGYFKKVYQEVGKSISKKKARKFSIKLKNEEENGWQSKNFLFDTFSQKGKSGKLCSSCEFFLVENSGDIEGDTGNDKCRFCEGLERLGSVLPKSSYFGWKYLSKSNLKEDKITGDEVSFFYGQLKFYLSKEKKNETYFKLYKGESNLNERYDFFLSSYIPVYDKSDMSKICLYCAKRNNCDILDSGETGFPLTFQCIAEYGSFLKDYHSEAKLGVFKADVDDLGHLFGKGLSDNVFSISRFLTMSRMLNAFFAGFVYYLQKNCYQDLYTVFSGGDDLLLLGHWERIIEFSRELNFYFKKFVGNRDDIHFSAGIEVINPSYPLRFAVEQSEEALEKSKLLGKDRITLFGATIKWKSSVERDFDKLIKLGDFFKEELLSEKEDTILSQSYFYKMIYFQKAFSSDNLVERQLAASRFYYSLSRNLLDKIKPNPQTEDEKEVNRRIEEIKKNLEELFGDFMDFIPQTAQKAVIPIFYALYASRREEGKERKMFKEKEEKY